MNAPIAQKRIDTDTIGRTYALALYSGVIAFSHIILALDRAAEWMEQRMERVNSDIGAPVPGSEPERAAA